MPAPAASCPDENTLVAFASGGLPILDATRVEEHLDTCPVCFSLVAELARADPDESDPTRMLTISGTDDARDDSIEEVEQTRLTPIGSLAGLTQIAPNPLGPTPPHAPSASNHPPTQLGRYTILHRLGAGAMGVVYAAVDRELGRRVALKLIDATGANATEGGARLLREAQALARLAHPHVVTVYDAGRVDGQVFVSMELVTGATLAGWLEVRKRSWREILGVFVQAGAGLAAAHAAGIIHRDFKPSNVLVDENDRARVVDFGLARAFGPVKDDAQTVIRANPMGTDGSEPISGVLGRSGSDLSLSGTIAGTPAYMAPEQYEGTGDARIDQFAFCVALFEALFERRPFGAVDAAQLHARLVSGVPPDIPLHADVPDWLARIVLRGLSREPERRFPSMEALLAAIEHAQRRRIVLRRAAISGGMLGVVGVVLAASYASDRPDPCDDTRDRLAVVWNDTSVAAMKNAVLATGAPFADDVWASASGSVERWAGTWTSAATEHCRALAKGEPSDVEVRRGMCLDRRLAELGALVEVWSVADRSVVLGLVDGAQWLAPIAACSDPPAVVDAQTLDLGRRAQAQRIRELLLRARAAGACGAFARGVTLASQALELAKALGDGDPLLGEAHLVLGELLVGDARLADGAVHVDAALQSSIARDDPRLLARAATAAAHGAAIAGRAPEQILQLVSIARAAVVRAPTTANDGIASTLGMSEAIAHRLGGRPQDAVTALSTALEARLASAGEQDLRVAEILVALGDASIAAARVDDGLAHQRRALAIREALLGAAHPDVAASAAATADALVAVGRIDEAREQSRRALSIREQAFGAEHPRVADSLGQLGAIEAELGHIDLALASHRRALAIREMSTDVAALTGALNRLGATLVTLGRWDEADGVLHRAIEVGTAALGPRHLEIAKSRFLLGRTAHGRGDFVRAASELSTALETRRMVLGEHDVLVGVTWTWLARAQRDGGRLDDALTAAQAALAVLDAPEDPDAWAHARLVIADVKWAKGDTTAALAGVTDALAILRTDPIAPAPAAMLDAWQSARTISETIEIDP